MDTFESSDGTVIAFERVGSGPAIVLVGGALSDMSTDRALARLLAATCTVYSYDRRGRGSSGDSPPYQVDLEVEDLEALILHTGGPASVFGRSTGAALALLAAAEGVALTRLAVYEPPYIVDDSRSRPSADLSARVRGMVAAGRSADAAERYLVEAAGMSPSAVAAIQAGPGWATMEAAANTITHDMAIMGDGAVPDEVRSIVIPTLVIDDAASPAWLRMAARTVAAAVPGARHTTLDGPVPGWDATTLAPVLADYLS